jgi:hypothetical protein
VNDWALWLNSNETRTALKLLSEATEELKEAITDGSHLQEKDVNKISLDYTYSLGQLDGMRSAIEMIRDIKDHVDEEKS